MTSAKPQAQGSVNKQCLSSDWHLRLFDKSVLKQAKLREITNVLSDVDTRVCLDLGSDNGVISYYLRKLGGNWHSGDMTEQATESISSLVGETAFLTDGNKLPFGDDYFDIVVIVDMLEHVEDDRALVIELARVMKPSGQLVINAPNIKKYSPLRLLRHVIGQTDEAHGHLRPGYCEESLSHLLSPWFSIRSSKTYSRLFSELIDTAIVFAYSVMTRSKAHGASNDSSVSKGLVITEKELRKNEKKFRIFSKIYPFVWLVSRLDRVVPFLSGYMRITVANRNTG